MRKDELELEGHHTAITVSDLDRSIEWYESKLGFRPIKKFERPDLGAKIAMMSLGNYHLELFCFKEYRALPDYRKTLADDLHTIGTKHFALGVRDIEKAYAVLKSRGVKFESEPSVGGSGHRYTFFKDLDGILIELFEIKAYGGGE